MLILIVIVCYQYKRNAEQKHVDTVHRDTTYVYNIDTVHVTKPIYFAKRVVDTMTIVLCDTLMLHDTLYLPIEQKVYKDSNYTAWVSGYRPRLDSIYVRERFVERTLTNTITPYRKKKRWGVGLQVGYGYNGAAFAPYLGVGVSYNFIRF